MLYAVIPIEVTKDFEKQLDASAAKIYKKLAPQIYFVSYSGTTMELSDALQFDSGGIGTGMVIALSNYWGFASKDLWEWLDLRKNGE